MDLSHTWCIHQEYQTSVSERTIVPSKGEKATSQTRGETGKLQNWCSLSMVEDDRIHSPSPVAAVLRAREYLPNSK